MPNKLIGYAEDSTLMAVVDSTLMDSTLIWGMKLNASKTKTMIVSRSCTMHPQSPPLTIGGTSLKESDDLVYWERHLIPN